MDQKENKTSLLNIRTGTLTAIIFATAAGRLALMGQPNISPVAGMALFGGAHFKSRWAAFGIPLFAMVITDILLAVFVYGTAGLVSRPFVYASFLGVVLLGRFIRNRRAALHIGGAALAGSLLFFVVTNFGMWLYSPLYPRTMEGLLACFTAAIPFFQKTLIGDLLSAGLLFGAFALSQRTFPALAEPEPQPAV